MTTARTDRQVDLLVDGMHCGGCAGTVEAALRNVPGVTSAQVNFATQRAAVALSPDAPPAAVDLIAAVERAGYRAVEAQSVPSGARFAQQRAELHRQLRRLLAASALGIPIIVPHLLASVPAIAATLPALHALHHAPAWWAAQALLAAGVIALAGGEMFIRAARGLSRATANMDLLVALGVATAYVSGLTGLVARNPALILFDAAAMIVLFVAAGKYAEARARGHASAALERLLSRVPQTALRVTPEGPRPVPIGVIQPGDVLCVAAPQAVPVDADVVSGRVAVDEALLTGESLPQERGAGQRVLGGTLVVDGSAELRAVATGAKSAAARLVRAVEQAQQSKPAWQRLADRVAGVFVPVVIAVAALTFVGWYVVAGAGLLWALERAIAVLVVACPCALGLAIPTAVLVGTARAAEHGVLVRDANALEAAARVELVLLDKTGTLTLGQPHVSRIETLGATSADEALRLAAALEIHAQHPLARAVVDAAASRGLAVPGATDVLISPGAGVRGLVDRMPAAVGDPGWLEEIGLEPPPAQRVEALSAGGVSVVAVAQGLRTIALLALTDTLHPRSAEAIGALRQLGVRAELLSGDRTSAVARVAQELGIDAFEAELTPEQKLARVQAVSGGRAVVAMVGDGINDAPALAAAQIGVAIGAGADVAREAADICLIGHDPTLIATAIRLSRRSARIMQQNLAWALGYNVVMLPIAMLTPLPPALATAAMMLSSLSVVGNALRLRRA